MAKTDLGRVRVPSTVIKAQWWKEDRVPKLADWASGWDNTMYGVYVLKGIVLSLAARWFPLVIYVL